MQIAGDEERRAPLLFQITRELGRGSGFAGAVQADHENARRFFQIERLRVAAEKRGQFVVKNFHDLLPGRDAAQHLFAERLFLHPCDEIFRHLIIDIRLE